jgi:hypothetical protein
VAAPVTAQAVNQHTSLDPQLQAEGHRQPATDGNRKSTASSRRHRRQHITAANAPALARSSPRW